MTEAEIVEEIKSCVGKLNDLFIKAGHFGIKVEGEVNLKDTSTVEGKSELTEIEIELYKVL